MEKKGLQELIDRYLLDQSTPEDVRQLNELLKDPNTLSYLETLMDDQLANSTVMATEYPEVVDRIKTRVEKEISKEKTLARKIPLKLFGRWAAAAAIIILVVTVGLLWFGKNNKQAPVQPIAHHFSQNIQPGKDGAILTLSDGRKIILDSSGNGVVATQSGSQIVLNNGQLEYSTNGSKEISYNTMSTPKGRQFRLLLPDGTKVWLNAASSLRYPTVFSGTERKVEVTGEAYFEVAKNKQMPFKVEINKSLAVVVLGTHFNINSYSDETSVNTTLLEGSVQIINGNSRQVIKPGQQAQATGDEKIKVFDEVNLKKVMAWKNGVFDFDNASLQDVMRQLERWYDIEVVYEKGVPNIEFVGTMGRDLALEDVLKGLKLSEVNFRLEGRKLIVMP